MRPLDLPAEDNQDMDDVLRYGAVRLFVSRAHAERHEGRSAYTLGKLLQVALDGMFFQTTRLLRWIVYVSFAVALAGVALATVFIALYFTSSALPGFTSLAVLTLLVGGFIIVSTGITGLYVGKIFEQVKGRPLYIVDRRTPLHEGEGASAAHMIELAGHQTPAPS